MARDGQLARGSVPVERSTFTNRARIPAVHVAFDLDGVLLDSESDRSWLDCALSRTLEEFGLADSPAHRSKLFPATTAEFDQLADSIGIPSESLWTVRDRYYREEKLAAIETGELQPFDDVDALYHLDVDGRHVISNSPREVVIAFVETYGFEDLFDACIGRGTAFGDIHQLKPDPHFYDELVSQTNAPHATYVYIGHTVGDERFAENTGMTYVNLDRAKNESLWTVLGRIK